MLFVGMIVGAVIGAIGGTMGILTGAVVGAVVGWALSTNSAEPSADRFRDLERSIRLLTERVRALEEAAPRSARTETEVFTKSQRGTSGDTLSEEREQISPHVEFEESSAAAVHPEADPQSAGPAPALQPPMPVSPSAGRRREPSALWNFLFGGNALVRVGVIVLFFGVAFLLKYAVEHMIIPIEVRLMGVALGALVLLAIGWSLRLSRPGYALTMQGGGIGVLYLTVFAAFRLYELLPSVLVLVLLIAMAALSATLAVLQDSRSLAGMGLSGGFLAPVLASTGGGSHVMLFSFYALLNLGILGIAWHKAWRMLNLLGFGFTFVIGLLWGHRYYRPELFASTEPFLILFFVFYVAIAALFAIRQEATIRNRVDGTLVFGTPLIAFGLQAALVRDIEYGAAFSALALSGFYLLLAKLLFSRVVAPLRLLVEAFIALGVVFGTLAIPLAFDGRWTAAAWALEGAAIVWVGVRQQKILARGVGMFLQFAAGAAFLFTAAGPRGAVPVFNNYYLGGVMISGAALFSAWYLKQQRARLSHQEPFVAVVLFFWGVLWWFGSGFEEITAYVRTEPLIRRFYRVHILVLFVTLSCTMFGILRRRLNWDEALYPVMALLPIMFALAIGEVMRAAHPLEYFGTIAWPIAFAAHLWLLRRHEDDNRWVRWWHAGGVWLLAGLGAWELAWQIGNTVQGGQAWQMVGWALIPGSFLAWLTTRGERLAWPVARHLEAYLVIGAVPLALFLWLWMNFTNLNSNGDPSPLRYLPLLNPLDLAQAGALLTLFAWFSRLRAAEFAPRDLRSTELAYTTLGIAGFVWLNGVLLRTLHHWADVPFRLDAMLRSMLVQASFSIFWTLLALCAMLSATRLRLRPLWLTGGGLMAVVVAKLFFIDLSNVGGVERIVSFIGVGLLMLLIGYVSPVPPSAGEEGK